MPRKATPRKKRTVSSRKGDMVLGGYTGYFFLAAVVATFILFFWVISPFWNVLIYAALAAVIFYPLQRSLTKFFKGRASIAAFCTTLFIFLIFLVPLVLFLIYIVQEAVEAYVLFESQLANLDVTAFTLERFAEQEWYSFVEPYLASAEVDIVSILRDGAQRISTFMVNQGANLLVGLGDGAVALFIFMLTTFYFLRDGEKVSTFVKNLSPLPPKYENEIEEKLKDATHAIVVGNFGTALIQGLVGMLGLLILGVDNAVFWGTIMIFASLIPYVGATIIWGPIAIGMMIKGDYVSAAILVTWGMGLVATVDNIARPYLIGNGTAMHPLATFLVVLGGVFVFGMKGIIFGPLILSLAITMVHIYELEYREVLRG